MNRFSRVRIGQAIVVAVVTALAVAALATLGASVSPAGTRAPAVEAAYPKKITICHRTKSKKNPYRTIRISRRALKAHLRHGDGIGPCPRAIFTMCHKAKSGKKVTIKVRGAKAHQKHLKRGDKIKACKKQKKKKKTKK
jgi:hypothetical protein